MDFISLLATKIADIPSFTTFARLKILKIIVIIRTIVRVLPLLRVCFTLSPFTVCLSNCGDWSRDLPSFKAATKMTVSSAFLALYQRGQRTPSQMRITC